MGEERDSGRDYDSGGESHVGNGADGGRSHGESRAAGDAGTSAGDVGNAGATGAITGNADAVGAGVTGATADAAAGDVGASGVARASGGRICAADIWLGALSFAAPAALLCVAFAVIGIYPFGPGASNTVIIIDNYHQYTPFLMEFGEMLRSGGSMFYSWNAGLGSNFLARFAYYLSSPLNVFSAFFGGGSFAEFVLALVLVRAGAAGLAFFAYLRAKFGSPGLKTAAFAMMYAMCAFFLAYYWNVMWFDCVAVFPLVALGLERLADRGRGLLYCLALAFTIVSNYFIAIMVCIYAALHYAAYYLGRDRGRPAAPRALAAAGRFALYSALAGGLSAAVTLPAFYGLLRSSAAGAAFPKNPRIYADMADVIANHLMMIKPSIMVGLPNIYCGVAALLLVPLYFANGRVAFREKLCSGLLLAFFLVSFNENQLDFLWHGTHFPNSLLFRFAFLYVFLALTLAYRALISLGGVREGGVFGCFAALAAFILFAEARPAEKTTKLTVYISLAFALIHALILRWNRSCELSGELPGELSGELSGGLPGGLSGEPPGGLSGGPPSELSGGLSEGLSGGPSGRPPSAFSDGPPNGLSGGGRPPSRLSGGLSGGGRPRRALLAEIALFVFVGAEMTINAGYGIGEAGVFPKDSYLMSIDSVKPAVEWAEAREEGFERIEFAEHTTYNTPVVYGYKGISYYSSTSYVAVNDMFGKLGLIHSNAWYVYRSSTPVLNSMFAVKYLLSRDRDFDNGIYPLVRREGDVRVYENPYFLPVGFMVDEAAEGWDVSRNNPFLVQEDFVAKATGLSEPLFTRLELEQGEHGGMTVTGGGQDGVFRYAPGGSAGEMKAVHRITARGNAGALAAGGGAGDGATGSGPQGAAAGGAGGAGGGSQGSAEAGGLAATGGSESAGGCSVYLYISAQNAESATVTNGGKSTRHDIKYPYVIDAEYLGRDGSIDIELEFGNSAPGSYTLYAYGFNRAAFERAYGRLSSQPLRVTSYSDTRLEGEISVKEDGLLFLSIPADDGWTALIDGEPASAGDGESHAAGGGKSAQSGGGAAAGAGGGEGSGSGGGALATLGDGALMALRLGRGEHKITLVYKTKGFEQGLLASLASALLLAAASAAPGFARRRRKASGGRQPLNANTNMNTDMNTNNTDTNNMNTNNMNTNMNRSE